MAEPDSRGSRAPDQGETLLENCPVCVSGTIRGQSDDPISYRCDNCKAVVEETLFGFTFKSVDAQYEAKAREFQGRTFTKPELDALSRKYAPEPAAGPKREKVPPRGKPAVAPVPAPEASVSDEEELWWELDDEPEA